MYYNTVALIPARLNSKRIPMKNIKTLGGHPLIAYAIQAALDAKFFDGVFVSSDSDKILEIAEHYGAKCIKRPDELATDKSPDAEWICHAFENIGLCFCYAIVRPTSPFRTGETIKRAFDLWDKKSLMKAVEPVKQHPGKMWRGLNYMNPYINGDSHLFPTQELEPLYIQNASLEWRRVLGYGLEGYQAFYTEGYEGFDINTPEDWILAEALIEKGYAKLPQIDRSPYDFTTV